MSRESVQMQPGLAVDGSVSPRTDPYQGMEIGRENITPITSRTDEYHGDFITITKQPPTPPTNRRDSDEWDASKVPPSRFQKRKGSIFAVPSSRDGRVDRSYAERYHEKLEEMGLTPRRKSVSK
ncbi:hypothetical protein VTJ83DRAFT_5002 [Remersonia thermophila]|uniref:Uncharacterized protein n=1 Tax=Remersonia thermophila TaxID=72144 RepID=A0ABR4DBK5_9PEZI